VTARRSVLLVAACAALLLLGTVGSASAGRMIATGHDLDCHAGHPNCATTGQQHFLKVSLDFVRGGAPDPSKPVLVLSCFPTSSTATDMNQTFELNFPGQAHANMCPSSPAFMSEPLTTTSYSAIIVGSSCHGDARPYSINGENCQGPSGTTPDSDALVNRKDAIAAFFNEGGGLLVLSGAGNGDNDPSTGPDTYYNFVPVGLGGNVVNAPFKLTDFGRLMGFEDSFHGVGSNNDINCCETHNSFGEPAAGSPVKVTERDSTGAPETVAVGGQIQNGQFVGQQDYPRGSNPLGLPKKKCVDKRKFKFRIHQPRTGSVRRVEVFVNKKRTKVVTGSRITKLSIARLPKKGRYKVRIVAFTTNLTQTISSRTYRACKKSRARTHVHRG
jgi:hypothetical protein